MSPASAARTSSRDARPAADQPMPIEDLPTTKALRAGRPAHGTFEIHSIKGEKYEIESTALPTIVIVAGMLLRNLVFDDGTATAFVIVATLFLALFIVGWRLAFAAMGRRNTASGSETG